MFVFAGRTFPPDPDVSLGRQVFRWFGALDDVQRYLVARDLGLPPSEDLELDLEIAVCEALEAWAPKKSLAGTR